jgi:4-amino-4-deoxy-L-arabinose transferase-like glycosyltransferase
MVFPRHQMPLYPLLQSIFYRPGVGDFEFFQVAKTVNIVLSWFILLVIFLILVRRFPPLVSVNLFLIVAFTVFIFKAAYVQAELLFYFLNFGLFLLLIELFQRPSVGKALAAGVLAGLAFLTKAAVMPALFIFSIIFLGREIGSFMSRRIFSPRSIAYVLLVALAFMAVIFPYARTSKRIYGSYLFNMNTSFYVWHDNWGQAVSHLKQMGPIEAIPENERPSLTAYMKSHTALQIARRVVLGGAELVLVALMAYGYFEYFVAYFGLFCILCLIHRKAVSSEIKRQPGLTAFILSYFLLHFLLYSFYGRIRQLHHLIMSLFFHLQLL